MQATVIQAPPPPQEERGLRGRIVEKKTGEIKADVDSASALVHRYVPPAPDKMQVVMNAGKASLARAGPGAVALRFPYYEKAGDSLTLMFERQLHQGRGVQDDHRASRSARVTSAERRPSRRTG